MSRASNRQKAMKMKFVQNSKQFDRDWLDLPYDVMANILSRVGVFDILQNAQIVCTNWYKICKDPAMWRVINMDIMLDDRFGMSDRMGRIRPMPTKLYYYRSAMIRPILRKMCKHAIDRSQGQLVDIAIWDLADKELIEYIADRSSQLRRLEVAYCTDYHGECWAKYLEKFPLLEELSLHVLDYTDGVIKSAGRCCPMLTTLKINTIGRVWGDDILVVIGKNLHELRHLELIGGKITKRGLQAILDGCQHLQLLDLRQCCLFSFTRKIRKRCLEKFKCVKLPSMSLEEYVIYYWRQQWKNKVASGSECTSAR